MNKVGRRFGRTLIGVSAAALAIAIATPAFAQDAGTGPNVQQEDQTDGAIVVTGQRASDRASLLKKRDADTTSEVVSANDVGKLPDQNVAEAVRRLSGVSVATDKGEGRYLIIRGIEPNLANVTLNGQTASAPEPENRNVKLDDIPSALIGSVTVIKTLTPDLDANAIAGQVDIDTVSAFDKKALFASARGIRALYEDTDRTGREGDIALGGTFGANRQFGLVVAANYSKRPSYSEDVLSGGRQTVGGVDLPIELDQRIYDPAIRTRKGAVANFDFRPSDDVKLFARFMYSQFGDKETRNRFRFFFPTTAAGYTGLTAAGGTITNTTARRLLRSRQEVTDTKTYSAGGEFNLGGVGIEAEYTHAKSNKKDPIRDEVEYRSFTAAGTYGATFTTGDGLLSNFTANAVALNPANYRLNNYKQVSRLAGETLDQFRVDVKIPFDGLGDGSSFKIGGKYLNRDRFQDQTGRTFNTTGAAATRTLASDLDQTIPTTFDGTLTLGPTINMDSVQSYVFANNTNTGLFTVNADQVSQSKTNDYQVKEKVIAGYVMAIIKSGGLTVIPGVRVEKTDGNTSAVIYRLGVTTLASNFDSFGHYEYTDWFPGINAKYEFSRNLQARAAITTAIGRPPFVNLAPTVSVEGGPAGATVTLGNPNLKPQRAFNLDAGLEYYFPGEGGISVSAFYKRIKNPIFATTALGQAGTFGGIAVTNSTVNSFGNGTEAEVHGVEFAIQKPFTFLPSPLDGFGVNANLTLSGSDLKVPGRTIKTPLVGQAGTIASGQLYYEKYGISARVAVSYRAGYLDTDGGLNSADPTGLSDGYFGKITTIDARIGYRPVKYVELFVEGTNLTDAQDYYYFSTESRFREAEKYGRSMRVGLSLTY
ncbi:TonB-dependent receptor [Sphingomonas sp.]|jgi:TonB-dependent receptor|uniref:TonB-dependent receptor n=1 Tax=Sphingomonas sp. TaxID=28214 RepID=UPI002ED7A5ED